MPSPNSDGCFDNSQPFSFSHIEQLDGNVSINSGIKINRTVAALSLPIIATYNLRSMFPKINSLKTDIIERQVDIAFLQEIWEQTEDIYVQSEIEAMLELDGLDYVSNPRPKNVKGTSYGGVAIITNARNFISKKLDVIVPHDLEVCWSLVKPKNQNTKFRDIIACSFYSPPGKYRNLKLADHIVTNLHMLRCKYPESALILGGDRNSMDISPILNCGLKLRNVVDKFTHGSKILDIIIMNTASFYNSPIIAPAINPDDVTTGKPSDHSVPVCTPHTDPYNRPVRNYRTINYRPLPESSIRKFGEWVTSETWDNVKEDAHPSEQVKNFEKILQEKLNQFCPEKSLKINSYDKPFITAELKTLNRKKQREYCKRGKSLKYLTLKKEFDNLYKQEAKNYVNKTVEELKYSEPGKMYSVLKRLGAKPGDTDNDNHFSLPSHVEKQLSNQESAEHIAEHFAAISQEFPPLSISDLPTRVQTKLQSAGIPPLVTEYETYRQIRVAKKPKSGVPSDLPRAITKEFAAELALPVSRIVNSILATGEWPQQWKLEQVVPIPKITQPLSEEDLRPISLTPFYSKVCEHFLVRWLMQYIGHKIDFRQYGGLKGNSINHYLIELVTFILKNQDSNEQTAVLACLVDFKKAFNRQSHNIIITKLSDLGVPGWLLKPIIGFLKERRMFVRFRDSFSSEKSLPGGGPQGTILALLIFLVLINDLGFKDQKNNLGEISTATKLQNVSKEIHLKYVDDFSVAEAINLKKQLQEVPFNAQPTTFHSRTGHMLPSNNSKVYQQLITTKKFADQNMMKLNFTKTQLMLFNPCSSVDFQPDISIDDQHLTVVEKKQILGLIVRSDLKWWSNTKQIVSKAFKKLWIIRRLKNLGAQVIDLVDIYKKQVRSVLEFGAPVWHSGITGRETQDIERVQKAFCRIILKDQYQSYHVALEKLELETLELRREKLCLNFALKAESNQKFKHWFKPAVKKTNTRLKISKYEDVAFNHARMEKSPLSYLTKLLNNHYK